MAQIEQVRLVKKSSGCASQISSGGSCRITALPFMRNRFLSSSGISSTGSSSLVSKLSWPRTHSTGICKHAMTNREKMKKYLGNRIFITVSNLNKFSDFKVALAGKFQRITSCVCTWHKHTSVLYAVVYHRNKCQSLGGTIVYRWKVYKRKKTPCGTSHTRHVLCERRCDSRRDVEVANES